MVPLNVRGKLVSELERALQQFIETHRNSTQYNFGQTSVEHKIKVYLYFLTKCSLLFEYEHKRNC